MGNRTTRRGRRVRTPELYSPEESVLDDYDDDSSTGSEGNGGGSETSGDSRSSEDDSMGSLRDFVANDDSEVEELSDITETEAENDSSDEDEDLSDEIEITEHSEEGSDTSDSDGAASVETGELNTLRKGKAGGSKRKAHDAKRARKE